MSLKHMPECVIKSLNGANHIYFWDQNNRDNICVSRPALYSKWVFKNVEAQDSAA